MTNVTQLQTPTTDANTMLDQLVARLAAAKKVEAEANANRKDIEEQILAAVGVKDEGSFSYKTENYKITTTGKMNRTVDWDKYESMIKNNIPEDMRPVVYKPTLSQTGIKWLQKNQPELYAVFADCMSAKPAKPSVSVVALELK